MVLVIFVITVVVVILLFCRDDALVRGRWRKLIRMFDEPEGCEWMNVSSGTGSPG